MANKNRLLNIHCLGTVLLSLFCMVLPSVGFSNSLCSETFSAKYNLDGRLVRINIEDVLQKTADGYELPQSIILGRSPFPEPTELRLRYYEPRLWQRLLAYAQLGELPNVTIGGRIFLDPWNGEPILLIAGILPQGSAHKGDRIVEFSTDATWRYFPQSEGAEVKIPEASRYDDIDYETFNF